MVTMSGGFVIPPVIRRFGRCGEWEQRAPMSPPSELGESSHGKVYRTTEPRRPASCYGGAETGTERVKSFVNGVISPFTACWQPADGACVPGCAPDQAFLKQPAVVSPHLDRVITYRDSRFEHEQDEYSRYPYRHSVVNEHQRPRHLSKSSPTRDPAAVVVEADAARNSPISGSATTTKKTKTTAYDKRKRSTDIAKPRSNDILCGRGGSSNRHLGNIHFRELVAANKQIYIGLTKKQKMLVARKIVDAIRKTGGRFLAKDLDTGLFYDIGLPRSLEKTSQALREKHSNEMPAQQVEDEGIEATVESHHSVIKDNISTDGSNSVPEDSPAEASPSSKSAKKISKNTEAPCLVIPPHLKNKFGGQTGSRAYEEDLENNHQPALSPSRSYHSEQTYDNHHSPYPPSPYGIPPGSSPSHHSQNTYPPVAGHPLVPPGHHSHLHHPRYPPSPPVPSANQYPPHPHYYYRGHPRRRAYPPHDDRDAYNSDYYARSREYERRSPHGMPLPVQFHRFPGRHPPSHRHGPPVPHGPPLPSSQVGPPQPGSSFGAHATSPPLPQFRRPQHGPQNYHGSPPSMPLPAPSSRVLYRTTNSGYVRSNSDVSPSRQREMKRPRNGDDHKTPISEASLSSAVKNSLSLDERVVGREREKQQPHESSNLASSEISSGSSQLELISPSSILQSMSGSRNGVVIETGKGSSSEKKADYSALSGLAALSTAAFLQLDDEQK